ncbi:hypothetical protein SAMN06298226_2236 [Nitrosovibrio sp. Nv4]|nr:hypothetical protein SAMN06298226_2236 [Nitrosovibrio sp. Nv4]
MEKNIGNRIPSASEQIQQGFRLETVISRAIIIKICLIAFSSAVYCVPKTPDPASNIRIKVAQ